MSKATPIPQKVRKIVLERADGRCEKCGRIAHLELHHRKYRSRGGKHTVSNIVGLCGFGNTSGCHGWAHTSPDAHVDGFSVASWDEPETKPVARRGVWVLLDEYGGVIAQEPMF